MRFIVREFVLQQSLARQSHGGLTVLVRMLKNWRMHRVCQQMLEFDDHVLKDIGLAREDLRQLMAQLRAMPLDADVPWELERRRLLASRQIL